MAPAEIEQALVPTTKTHSCKACRRASRSGKISGCRGYIGETKHQLLERKIRNDSTDLKEEEIHQYLKSIKKSVRGALHTGLKQVTDQTQGFDEAEKSLSRLSQLWEETADLSLLPKIFRAQEVVERERQKVSGRESVCRRALKGLNGEERRAMYDKHADVTCSYDVDILRQNFKDMLSQGTSPSDSRRMQLLNITKGIAKLETKLSKATEDDDDDDDDDDEQLLQPARRAAMFVHEGILPEEDPLRAAEIDWVCRRVAAGGLPEYKMS